jgi:schlafen family protein
MALALAPGELTYQNMRDAVTQSIEETEDLDFKQALPPRDDRKLREFAKDVAAMANTRGGLIIFGITDNDGRAGTISGVASGESERQRLSNVAASRIHPIVPGLNLFAINGREGDPSLLVISIPASADAPHLIGNDDQIGIPFRDGPNTRWMRERTLERAYADRFTRRASSADALREQRHDVSEQLDTSQGSWIVVVSRPTTPVPVIGPVPTRDNIRNTLIEALRLASEVSSDTNWKSEILRELNDGANNPRIGLRRWIARSNAFGAAGELSKWVHVELHHDGSTSFAASLEAWNRASTSEVVQLQVSLIESAIVDAVVLSAIHARNVGSDSTVGIEVSIRGHLEPIVVVDNRTINGLVLAAMSIVPGSRQVTHFKRVYSEVGATEGVDGIRAVARTLCDDTLNQFGVRASLITAPETPR